LIAVDTLAVLAEKVSVDSGIVVPMIDARRMEVFTQMFDKDLNVLSTAEALIVDENAFTDMTENIHLIGDGALKCKTVLIDNKFIFHEDVIYPSANDMGRLSHEKYIKNNFEDVAYFEPYYLKDFMLTTKK